jgi:hypothetical protein
MTRQLHLAALALVASCSGRSATKDEEPDEPVEIKLAEQPIITDGIRDHFLFDLAAYPPSEHAAALARAVRTIRIRFQRAGIVGHVSIHPSHANVLVVDQAPTDAVPATLGRDLVLRTGRLELQVAESGSGYMAALAEHVKADSAAVRLGITSTRETWRTSGGKQSADWVLHAADREEEVFDDGAPGKHCRPVGVARMRCQVTGRAVIEAYVAGLAKRDPRFAMPDDRMLVYERLWPLDQPSFWRTHLVSREVELTGEAIKRAGVKRGPHDEHGYVEIELDRAGARALATTTTRRSGDKLAIVIDGRVESAPIIDGPLLDGRLAIYIRVEDPRRQDDEERDLAIALESGALPGPARYQVALVLEGGRSKYEENGEWKYAEP